MIRPKSPVLLCRAGGCYGGEFEGRLSDSIFRFVWLEQPERAISTIQIVLYISIKKQRKPLTDQLVTGLRVNMKRNYLGTFVYYYNILNYVISDMLSQWDLAVDAKITFGKNILGHNDKKRLRRDSLWVANNHSIAIIGVLSAPIALLFMVLVSLFLGHKITVCYIVLILFCLSLYIMSISKYDHCYFEYFESIRDINIKKWRYQCLMFAIADMIVGAVLVCVLIHI